MSERNEAMAAMLAATAPAARDYAFDVALMARIERRRFARAMTRNLLAAALAALVLILIMPQLDLAGWAGLLSQLTANPPILAALLIAAFAAWYFRPREA